MPGIYPLEACLFNEDRGVLDLWGKKLLIGSAVRHELKHDTMVQAQLT